jgi:hypothetical protein
VDNFAVRLEDERTHIAVDIPDTYWDEFRRLGVAGAAAEQALREILEARARREHQLAQAGAATPGNPATPVRDEHLAVGRSDHVRTQGAADRDQASADNAATLASQWYPDGLHGASALPAHAAGERSTRTQLALRRTDTQSATRGR